VNILAIHETQLFINLNRISNKSMLYVGLTMSVIEDNDSSSTKPNDSSGPSSKWSLNRPLFPQLDPHEF
jgi:hypothetical protein